MTSPSVALKYFCALPLVSCSRQDQDNGRYHAREQVHHDRRPEALGEVPQRPSGAAPSNPATACARSDPISQTTPEDSKPRITPTAAMSARIFPAPVSTAARTGQMASVDHEDLLQRVNRSPPRWTAWTAGSTSRMARMGTP